MGVGSHATQGGKGYNSQTLYYTVIQKGLIQFRPKADQSSCGFEESPGPASTLAS